MNKTTGLVAAPVWMLYAISLFKSLSVLAGNNQLWKRRGLILLEILSEASATGMEIIAHRYSYEYVAGNVGTEPYVDSPLEKKTCH